MICIQQKMIETENILNKNENKDKYENKDKHENKLIVIQNKIGTQNENLQINNEIQNEQNISQIKKYDKIFIPASSFAYLHK